MKFTPGSLFNDLRGSSGGITVGRNASGGFVRNRTTPTNPRSVKQLTNRSDFAYLAQQWRLLTADQRNSWIALALLYPQRNSLGQVYYLTGAQLYQKLNTFINNNGGVQRVSAPSISLNNVQSLVGCYVQINVVPGSEDIKLYFSNTLNTTEVMTVESTGFISTGISHPKKFKMLGSVDHTFISGNSIKLMFVNLFGDVIQANDFAFFRLQIVDSLTGFQNIKIIASGIGTV